MIIIAVDQYDYGCAGKRYDSVRAAVRDGAYSVWNLARMRSFNRATNDPVGHFKRHMKINRQTAISKEQFFSMIESLPDRETHVEFYNRSLSLK